MRIATESSRTRRLISLTPLIDVVFILLVFFMLASNFTQWRHIPLHSASLGGFQSLDERLVTIQLEQDRLVIGKVEVRLNEVSELIKSLHTTAAVPKVLLMPGKGVELQRVVSVLDELEANGIKSVTLVR